MGVWSAIAVTQSRVSPILSFNLRVLLIRGEHRLKPMLQAEARAWFARSRKAEISLGMPVLRFR
jgi:hypothetical protein